MSASQASLAGLIEQTGAGLKTVAIRLKNNIGSRNEIMECSRLASALADAMRLYAETMSETEPDGRHSLRQWPPST